jgi:hypothetical protein
MEMLILPYFMLKKDSEREKIISTINDGEGRLLTTHEDKAGAFFEFYEGLLGFAEGREAMMDLNALGVPTHDLNALYVPFSMKKC